MRKDIDGVIDLDVRYMVQIFIYKISKGMPNLYFCKL